jgi:Flp pilus assembly pilin Flp
MKGKLKQFTKDQDGAVTVDWVVLTGVVMAMALIQLGPIGSAISAATDLLAADIDTSTPPSTP